MSPVTSGRAGPGSTYSVPVVAILANFRGPDGDKPSLLSHEDVVTLFHELGHTFQATLTRAPYATLSGSNVEWDFIEAPSQALEEWAWQPQVLDGISGLYMDPSQKLPADFRDRMIAARDMDAGFFYTRQLMFASEDMAFHTVPGPVDVTSVSNFLYREMMGIPPTPGAHEPATIEHFMSGYDAGYYSYLWSQVYAFNIFAKFREDGLASPATGSLSSGTGSSNRGTCRTGACCCKDSSKKSPRPPRSTSGSISQWRQETGAGEKPARGFFTPVFLSGIRTQPCMVSTCRNNTIRMIPDYRPHRDEVISGKQLHFLLYQSRKTGQNVRYGHATVL
ncbi:MULTISPECIES: M3 family metallopeptidase [unclassified Methanoregula]|uniref:M3 family metallopeptidase n=1 Tax=unclassified Methanoregula TaxID=2649730 RepID=UPI0009CC7342|nr:MAG: oligopeptidase A [Methanoregula sp. PtaB.Bin085]OPY32262.1 MAG: oligopeptidase A [Methanoregula sp. PtaU1.Bin006]